MRAGPHPCDVAYGPHGGPPSSARGVCPLNAAVVVAEDVGDVVMARPSCAQRETACQTLKVD